VRAEADENLQKWPKEAEPGSGLSGFEASASYLPPDLGTAALLDQSALAA